MEPITIYPENEEQLNTVKSILKALKVPFEPQLSPLPTHVKKSMEKSMEQISNGETIDLTEFKKKHFLKE